MRLFGLLLLMLSLGLSVSSCTKKETQPQKKTDKGESDDDAEKSVTPPVEDDDDGSNATGDGKELPNRSQGDPNSNANTPSQSTEIVKMLNGWDGKSDVDPQGLKFWTRGFEQAPQPSASSTAPNGVSAGNTFSALVAEYRRQGCVTCHTSGGRRAQTPLDDHARMAAGGAAAAYVTASTGRVNSATAQRMPPGNSLQPTVRTQNSSRITQLINAWRAAGYPR